MEYRTLGKTGEKVSILGFGCMRLPILKGDMSLIDEEKATKMVEKAIGLGVNYFDTAWSYHSKVMGTKGESEPFLGKALKNGLREKVFVATKLPSWLIGSAYDMEKILDEQLERLETGHIDFYLVHALNSAYWEKLKKVGITRFLDKAVLSGKVRHVGFSFHDNLDLFKQIADFYPWEFCQIQFNYLDEYFQAGIEGLNYASKKGMGVVGMEPLRGGKIAKNLPAEVLKLFYESGMDYSPAKWAFRWVYSHNQLGTVLSGMNSLEEVAENCETASSVASEPYSAKEYAVVEQVKSHFNERVVVGCTSCSYCMPCTSGVNIPGVFSYLNDFFMFGTESQRETTRRLYHNFIGDSAGPGQCTECGQCEDKCPQKIEIIQSLKKAADIF